MATICAFNADDSLTVTNVAGGIGMTWNLTAEQAVRHDAMFRPDMTPAQRVKLDAIKAAEAAKAAAAGSK